MRSLSKNTIIYGAGLLYLICVAVFTATENYLLMVIPFGLALAALTFLAMDKVLWFLLLSTPFSIEIYFEDLKSAVGIPGEPFMAGLLILFFLKLIVDGRFQPRFSTHPMSITLIVYLSWMFLTALTSSMPFVSFKYFLSRLWFVVVFYFLFSLLLKKKSNIKTFYWFYMAPLTIVAIYTMVRHIEFGLTKQASTWVMTPFFREHTNYGAALAMYVPISFAFAFFIRDKLWIRFLYVGVFMILTVALILSFTRAAWISVVVAAGVLLILVLRVKWYTIVSGFFVIAGIVLFNWTEIYMTLSKNQKVSSDNLGEHVTSTTNISTDVSNLERINRWKSAFRMYKERPVTGWGPGTYMFQYAPFQKPHEKTIISTNNADLGNAHSEYLGPLAEMGLPGLILVLLIVLQIFILGHKICNSGLERETKILVLAAFLGLITYFSHGLLNNFLDIDKSAVSVFSFISLLVCADRYYIKEKKEK
ncbi:MAG: O-antigen ligase family protein [Thermaurantimonas sp.]